VQKVGIIGTAGRKEDKDKMTFQVWKDMQDSVKTLLIAEYPHNRYRLVSGGAAWADHLAVDLLLSGYGLGLTLYLPAEWDSTMVRYQRGPGDKYRDPGQIANYYHGLFSEKMGIDTLAQIEDARDRGAELVYIPGGFHARNLRVGQVDWLICLHWNGAQATKPKGGSLHTWNNSRAQKKTYIALESLQSRIT
jgi:hypothetical protein